MDEQLPYEHEIIQKLKTIPLPDEDAAWKDMRQRLDEEDTDDIIVPPVKGCGWLVMIGIISLLLVGSFLLWNRTHKHKSRNEINISEKKPEGQKFLRKDRSGKNIIDSFKTNFDTVNINENNYSSNVHTSKAYHIHKLNTSEKKRAFPGQYHPSPDITIKKITENKAGFKGKKIKHMSKNIADSTRHTDTTFNHQDNIAIDFNYKSDFDSISKGGGDTSLQADTALKKITSSSKQDSLKNKKQKKESPAQQNFSFAAGLAGHQQLPLKGQTFVPYNAEGRKGSLLDYIPSVFFRAYYKQKLFFQLDIRYGAPQLTKQFIYSLKTVYDTAFVNRNISIISNSLKKTYYHQLPVSIYYNIIPRLSVGAGIVWNRFNSAVVQQDINTRNINTNNTTFTSKILNIKKDSVFSTSYLQAMLEAEYNWKRFSLGMMYARGLQPYIKFRSAIGAPAQEKNSSLQIFLRYELWRSKKK